MPDDTTDATEGLGIPVEELTRVARAFSIVMESVQHLVGTGTSELAQALEQHLGVAPEGLPVLAQEVPSYQLVDVQVALDQWTRESPERSTELIGVSSSNRHFQSLSDLIADGSGARVGAVDYVDMADSPDSTRSCVDFGIFLMVDGPRRAATLLRGPMAHQGPMAEARIETVASDPDYGREVLSELRRLAVDHSVLRGQVLALGPGEGQQYGSLRFMRRPELARDQLILPEAVLGRIEGHVFGIAAERSRLKAAGLHLKRGVLLFGPPGTGKTHTIRYLLAQQPEVTAFLLSGQALVLIAQACGLARVLQPSMVILEDIDLVAPDRSFGPMGTNPLLFEVLNQIDGLGDDVDVTFVLTTNRVDILERALAERPGRVDAAVEIAPPDADGRAQLLRLYGSELGVPALSDESLAAVIDLTEGRTATYLREVVRRSALLAAAQEPTGPLRVDGALLSQAATALGDDHVALTRSLFGEADENLEAGIAAGRPSWGPMNVSRMMHGAVLRQMARGGPVAPFGPD
ncbi:MAG TPA: ATP-binding protein [Acidimicrobiales bacterium]|nr:ATP-binding protein [Acidimicrobiales bacterium]